jgi:hypothetical protein
LVLLVRLKHDPGYGERGAEALQVKRECHCLANPLLYLCPHRLERHRRQAWRIHSVERAETQIFGRGPGRPALPRHAMPCHAMPGIAGWQMAVAVVAAAAAAAVSRSSIGDILLRDVKPGVGWDDMGMGMGMGICSRVKAAGLPPWDLRNSIAWSASQRRCPSHAG